MQGCPRGEQLMGFRFSGLIAGVEAEVEYSSGYVGFSWSGRGFLGNTLFLSFEGHSQNCPGAKGCDF